MEMKGGDKKAGGGGGLEMRGIRGREKNVKGERGERREEGT